MEVFFAKTAVIGETMVLLQPGDDLVRHFIFASITVCANQVNFRPGKNDVSVQILVILITLKLQIGACNGQITKFELSTVIMRPKVRVFLGDHRKFVVGPFIFSFN